MIIDKDASDEINKLICCGHVKYLGTFSDVSDCMCQDDSILISAPTNQTEGLEFLEVFTALILKICCAQKYE